MKYEGKTLRHEYKYLIDLGTYRTLASRLSRVMQLDHNALETGSYLIRSLYFDNLYQSLYHDKEDGIFFRRKYRIRTYGYSVALIKLAREEKYDWYIHKTAEPLSMKQYREILAGKTLPLTSDSSLLMSMFHAEQSANLLRPSGIVEYTREPYVQKEGNVRITFDRNLRAVFGGYDLFRKDLYGVSVFPPDRLILEVKYDDYLPSHLDHLLSLRTHILCSASKYTLCRDPQKNLSWKENIV